MRAAATTSESVAVLDVSFPSVTTMMTLPAVFWWPSACTSRSRSSYILVPAVPSTATERSAWSESVVLGENGVGASASLAKVETAIWSDAGLASANAFAAATAVFSGAPIIDRDRSIARTTLFVLPRLIALAPSTVCPFSSSVGGFDDGLSVTTVTRTRGKPVVSTARTWTAAEAAAGTTRQSAATAARTRFLIA